METTFGTFTGRDWRNLLTDIYDGQAVPVTGSELSILPGQGGLTLYDLDPAHSTLLQRLRKPC